MNEQAAPSPRQIGLKYGLYVGLILVIYSMVLQLTGLALNSTLSYLSYVILIVGIVLAHREYKQEGDGTLSFGQGITIGVILSFIASLVSGVVSYIYLKFIDSSMLEMMKEKQYEAMADRGMSDEDIEQAMEMTSKVMEPELLIPIGIVSMVFFGLILAAIITIFTKRD